MFDLHLATRSDIGQRRHNEDRVAVGRGDRLTWALLADGAGGHAGGEEASRLAIEGLAHATRVADLATDSPTPAALGTALVDAHRALQQRQVGAAGAARMHSTAVALWIEAATGHAMWAHVGDSRLYRVRRGAVDMVTVDDSMVQRMVESGFLTAEQARRHPRKNQLVAALGAEDDIEPHTLAAPARLEAGDAFLLCSDGWWECLSDESIAATMRTSASPEAWLDAMQQAIVANHLPRQDNFSAAAVWVTSGATQIR